MGCITWRRVWIVSAVVVAVAVGVWLQNESATVRGFIRQPEGQYDYIIVGAGTSGCVLAAKLSEDPSVSVLLIEAGRRPPWYSWIPLLGPALQGSDSHDWRFRTVPQKSGAGALVNNESFWPQGKMVGGSGQINFLIHSTGSSTDFDTWNITSWDADTMRSIYDRLTCWKPEEEAKKLSIASLLNEQETCSLEPILSKFCGGQDTMHQCPSATIKLNRIDAFTSPIAKAFLEAGHLTGHRQADLNQWSSDKGGLMASENLIDTKDGTRWSSYGSYLLPALQRPGPENLHVLTGSNVNKVVWRGNQVVGVQYVDKKKRRKLVRARKEVILSAGTIKTTQILQLSGIGPSHVLEPLNIPIKMDLPVGENLQDHLQVPLFVELDKAVSFNLMKLLRPTEMWNYLVHGKGVLATSGIEVIGHYKKEGDKQPQGMLIVFNMGSVDAELYTSVANIRREAFQHWFPKSGNYSQEGFVLISLCLHPRSRGTVRVRSVDPSQQPEIDPQYLSHPYDVQCTIDTIRQGIELLETEPFRSLGARLHWPTFPQCGVDFGSPSYMECLVRMASLTMYHPVGTNAMGNDDIEDGHCPSVVDSQLRVRGVNGLRVVDASVLPSLPSGTLNSILVAMAERVSQLIVKS